MMMIMMNLMLNKDDQDDDDNTVKIWTETNLTSSLILIAKWSYFDWIESIADLDHHNPIKIGLWDIDELVLDVDRIAPRAGPIRFTQALDWVVICIVWSKLKGIKRSSDNMLDVTVTGFMNAVSVVMKDEEKLIRILH